MCVFGNILRCGSLPYLAALAALTYARASLHLSVTYCQSSALTLSAGKSLEPMPTQYTPALNHAVRFSSVGATPPVTMIFDHGMGALRFLTMAGP